MAHGSLSAADVEEFRSLFDSIDSDGGGEIDAEGPSSLLLKDGRFLFRQKTGGNEGIAGRVCTAYLGVCIG